MPVPSAPPPPSGSGPAAPVFTPTQPANSSTNSVNSLLAPDSGLWVGVALLGGIAFSGTRAAPIICGILGIGLIYQLQNLLQGK